MVQVITLGAEYALVILNYLKSLLHVFLDFASQFVNMYLLLLSGLVSLFIQLMCNLLFGDLFVFVNLSKIGNGPDNSTNRLASALESRN